MYQELFFDIQQNIFDELIIFPRFLRHKLSLKNQESRGSLAKGK